MKHYFGILSGISSDTLSDILSGVLSGISFDSRLRSGGEHCQPKLAAEVLQSEVVAHRIRQGLDLILNSGIEHGVGSLIVGVAFVCANALLQIWWPQNNVDREDCDSPQENPIRSTFYS